MSNVPGEPYSGTFFIDLNHLRGILFDVARGGLRGLRREQPGIDEVIHELETELPRRGAEAGIPDSVYKRFCQYTSHLEKIRAVKAPLEKLLEVLKESEAKYEHERENTISQMTDSIRSTARRESNPGLLAPFERLLKYNSQIADKAAKTRRRNTTTARTEEPTDEAG